MVEARLQCICILCVFSLHAQAHKSPLHFPMIRVKLHMHFTSSLDHTVECICIKNYMRFSYCTEKYIHSQAIAHTVVAIKSLHLDCRLGNGISTSFLFCAMNVLFFFCFISFSMHWNCMRDIITFN